MPIDPVALRARVAKLAERVYDPPGLAAAVRSLLDDYADRTHRVSPQLAATALVNAYRTPAPVVRAIIYTLRNLAQASPHAALDLVRALWAGGSREERRIAAELLGVAAPQIPAKAFTVIESWLPDIESGETAEALAEFGLGPLMRADPAAHLPRTRQWTQSSQKWLRRFGVAALSPLIRDRKWDGVPAALEALRNVMTESEPEVRSAAAHALEGLIRKSPVEVGRFLRDQSVVGNHNTRWIVRVATLRLTPEEQAMLDRVMRA
jgi:hypothetical protein